MRARFRQDPLPVVHIVADQVLHLDPAEALRAAQGPAADGPDMLLELGRHGAPQRPMAGIVDPRGDLVDHEPLAAIPGHEEHLDRQDAHVVQGLGNGPGDLDRLPLDDVTKQNLLRFQFAGQTSTYRGEFTAASFDIIERDGVPIGRLIVDPGNAEVATCLVDFVLLPEVRNDRLGRAIITAILAEQASLGRKVRVKVLYHNEPSRRMCAALGFVEISQEMPFIQLEWSAPAT